MSKSWRSKIQPQNVSASGNQRLILMTHFLKHSTCVDNLKFSTLSEKLAHCFEIFEVSLIDLFSREGIPFSNS